jgi:translocation and assembly module TamB
VEPLPFRDWELDVAVRGDRFMRLRTPLVTGVGSIDMSLDGTLGTPRALGDAWLDEATVKLPFANFTIVDGKVSLVEENPYEPRLQFRGEGRRLGYDLLMELEGSANEPRLVLSSDPALPAEDVLLFVMAGVAPQDEVSYSQGRRALQLGMFLGRELVGDLLGLEAGDRLTVSSGERLSRSGRETYRFSYELNDRWALDGEYDEFDYYNAGLKWRWYPWKRKGDDRAKAEPEAAGGKP